MKIKFYLQICGKNNENDFAIKSIRNHHRFLISKTFKKHWNSYYLLKYFVKQT